MTNVIIVSNYYPPDLGAASNRIGLLAQGLAKDYNVSVICPMPNYPKGRVFEGYRGKIYSRENYNNIDIFRYYILPTKSKNPIIRFISMISFSLSIWLFILHFKRILKAQKIIIQNSPILVSFFSIIFFKKIFSKEILLNVSDLWPESAVAVGAMKNGLIYKIMKKIERFNYQSSEKIIGQSEEICNYIGSIVSKNTFTYRNLQPKFDPKLSTKKNNKIIYAGLLGVAQGVLEIIKNINLTDLDIEIDIYGDGNEKELIIKYLNENPNNKINYKGVVSKKEFDTISPKYLYSLVPLNAHIVGAVPSKIFDFSSKGVPIILMASGEAADIVKNNNIGYILKQNDYWALNSLLKKISVEGEDKNYKRLVLNCNSVSKKLFCFENQLINFKSFLHEK